MPTDIHLTPLYRINGQEPPAMHGVLALTPPNYAARGREQDRLLVYLLLAGTSTFTETEYKLLAESAARVFYETPRALTSALRAATNHVNSVLLERNFATKSEGRYVIGWLALAAVRDTQCTFSLSGPMHAYWFGRDESRQFFEPSISGKGLGISQSLQIHYAQASLAAGDLMLFCGRVPDAWAAPLADAKPSSLDAMRRRLVTLTGEDLNAALFQVTDGTGMIHLRNQTSAPTEKPQAEETLPDPHPSLPVAPEAESTPEAAPASTSAHVLQPSAYAIPPQTEEHPAPLADKTSPREFPASIPRAKPKPAEAETPAEEFTEEDEAEIAKSMAAQVETKQPESAPVIREPETPREPSERARQAARAAAGGIRSIRQISETVGEKLRHFLPRLLPSAEVTETSAAPSTNLLAVMAILIPLIVVTLASVVYLRFGRSEQYDAYLRQAQQMREQALALTNPVEQWKAWENVLVNVGRAEEQRQTNETITLRREAESKIDSLLGITRMQFNAAFSSKPNIQVSRMVASGRDLYMLNAVTGEVARAFPAASGRGFQMDTTFTCNHANAGPLVDMAPLPAINIHNATLLGIDAGGNLVYCAPGQVAQFASLPTPDTNWGRVTGFSLENGVLYVLDASSRAVWVYNGKDSAYIERPTFFFGQQTPTQDVIDFIISGDEMYLLHADGRVSTCTFSRITTSASDCKDPLPKENPFPAYANTDLFSTANFTQILFAAPPDTSILLLDSENQNLMRFSPRMLELQAQFRPTMGSANPIPPGAVGAVAVSPDHVLYLAVNGQVYFALNMP
jgi:hypothetical protein